jgi:hypothetical protein
MLHASTRPPEEWTYNLWPRNSAVIGNNAAVPDLAPDDGNSPVQVVPSPARASLNSLVLDSIMASGLNTSFVPAFTGLDVAIEQFVPSPAPTVPPNPVRVAPVFSLNYGDSVDARIPGGLNVALSHYPTDPTLTLSPIFFGLAEELAPAVDA